MFGIFAMARSLRTASTEQVLDAFEKELRSSSRDFFQLHASRCGPDDRAIYKLVARRLSGPRGARLGWFKFEHEASYTDSVACPVFAGPATVSGDLDLIGPLTIDTPHKLGLAGAVRLIKQALVRRGFDVAPLVARDGSVIALHA